VCDYCCVDKSKKIKRQSNVFLGSFAADADAGGRTSRANAKSSTGGCFKTKTKKSNNNNIINDHIQETQHQDDNNNE